MQLPKPPPWMTDLPLLHHPRAKAFAELPSHAASQWLAGRPVFSVDQRKMRILAMRQRCWQCGHPLVKGCTPDGYPSLPGYVVVTEADRNDLYAGLHTQAFGPLHKSCALYAALACPFLRYSGSRRRVTGTTSRGTASILGYSGYGIFFPPNAVAPCFGYFSHVETIPLTNRKQIAAQYREAVNDDSATGVSDTAPLRWTDSPKDISRLEADWAQTARQIRAAAGTATTTIDRRVYRGQRLDQNGRRV